MGSHESTEARKLALDHLLARNLREPLLVIADSNPGLTKAVRRTWPTAPRQRCIVFLLARREPQPLEVAVQKEAEDRLVRRTAA